MSTVVVRYTVKADHVAKNLELVRDVYEELHNRNPGGLRYATFQLADEVSFVHVAITEDDGSNPLTGLAAFQRFQAGIAERCVEGPEVSPAREVGSFRL